MTRIALATTSACILMSMSAANSAHGEGIHFQADIAVESVDDCEELAERMGYELGRYTDKPFYVRCVQTEVIPEPPTEPAPVDNEPDEDLEERAA